MSSLTFDPMLTLQHCQAALAAWRHAPGANFDE